ncbi:MAG: rod-binding protein [Pseudomonadota bacterium]
MDINTSLLASAAANSPRAATPEPGDVRRAAEDFEAAFLAEMLKHTGLGETPEGFGGGSGEDAFGSLLVREQAQLMAERGGIGLADAIEQALLQRGARG